MDAHIILKPDLYSIQNLVDVKNGELGKKLQNLIAACNKHVMNCQVKKKSNILYKNVVNFSLLTLLIFIVMPSKRVSL